MDKLVYLDNAATTQPDPKVLEAMQECLKERWGNPSSQHETGSRAKMRLEEARINVANLLKCHSDEVYFTSGGTEADNWALLGTLDYHRDARKHLVTVATEHHAVIDTAEWCRTRGCNVTVLSVGSEGRLDLDEVRKSITEKTAVVSVMHVNNEIGTIQEIAAIGAMCRERGVTFHTDCVQSFGKIPLSIDDLNADLVSISSHKIHGPKGVGALIIKRGTGITPRQIGGTQERKLRPGTENMPGIVGFGCAAALCRKQMLEEMPKVKALRDRLEKEIVATIPDLKINGSREHRSPSLLNVSFLGCEGESLMVALDRKGICVSTGSACSAGAAGASHVPLALGLSVEDAQASIRFSFGRFNQDEDVDAVMEVLPDLVARQRELTPLGAK